jgi:hypothetical protein
MMQKLQELRVSNWIGKVKHGARRKAEVTPEGMDENDIGDVMPQSYDWLKKPYMLREKVFSWAVKAKLDLLPCRGNLFQWNLSRNKTCLKCRGRAETTHHVLNGCPWRLNAKLYTARHNAIQDLVANEVQQRSVRTNPCSVREKRDFDPEEALLCDKSPFAEFSSSNLRPDLQLVKFMNDPVRKSNFMVDIKCPDVLSRDYRGTHRRNTQYYRALVNNVVNWTASIETFVVSSNGVVPMCSLRALQSF